MESILDFEESFLRAGLNFDILNFDILIICRVSSLAISFILDYFIYVIPRFDIRV